MTEELTTQKHSDEAPEETPARATTFLFGVSNKAALKTLLFEECLLMLEDDVASY